jgi:transposase-like protein
MSNGISVFRKWLQEATYRNNIVEQDHRAIKRVTRPMLNFKSFRSASNVLAGVELMCHFQKTTASVHWTGRRVCL